MIMVLLLVFWDAQCFFFHTMNYIASSCISCLVLADKHTMCSAYKLQIMYACMAVVFIHIANNMNCVACQAQKSYIATALLCQMVE